MKRAILALAALLVLFHCAPAWAGGRHLVQGKVRLASGAPAAGLGVVLSQAAGKKPLRLGSDRTDRDGTYAIKYNPRAGLKAGSLYLTVQDKKGRALHRSGPIKRPRPREVINIILR